MNSLKGLEIDIERVGRADWPGGVTLYSPWVKPQFLSRFELWFIWRGKGTVETDGVREDIRQGQLYLFRPGRTYHVEQDPATPLGVNYTKFDIYEQGNQLTEAPKDWPTVIDQVEADLAETITRRIVELFWQNYVDYKDSHEAMKLGSRPYFKFIDDEYEHLQFAPIPISIFKPEVDAGQGGIVAAEVLFKGLLFEILHQSSRRTNEDESNLDIYQRRLISQIAMRIQQDPALDVSVPTLAEECGYSPDYFTRLFKRVMNCSPQQYQVFARVNRACRLLRESDLLIKEIAAQLGYNSEFFFSRQFKSTIGQSPKAYREKGPTSR